MVIPSPLVPESSAAKSVGAAGVLGTRVSMVTVVEALNALTLPTESVCRAV